MNPAILAAIIGGGASVGGALINKRSQDKQYNAQQDLIRSELERRNQLQGLVLPAALRALGIKNASNPFSTTGSGGGYAAVTPENSTLGKVFGMAGGSPAASIANMFGKGRRTANSWVKLNQNPFDSAMRQLPDNSPQEQAEVQAYQRAIRQMIGMGGAQGKVGSQALQAAARYYPSYNWSI